MRSMVWMLAWLVGQAGLAQADCPAGLFVEVQADADRRSLVVHLMNRSAAEISIHRDHLPFVRDGGATIYTFESDDSVPDPQRVAVPVHRGPDDRVVVPAGATYARRFGVRDLFPAWETFPDGVLFWYWEAKLDAGNCIQHGAVRFRRPRRADSDAAQASPDDAMPDRRLFEICRIHRGIPPECRQDGSFRVLGEYLLALGYLTGRGTRGLTLDQSAVLSCDDATRVFFGVCPGNSFPQFFTVEFATGSWQPWLWD